MSVMKTIVEIIDIPVKCRYREGLSFSGWINPGDFLIPPTINLGCLQRILGKGIHKHRIIEIYRFHRCLNHHQKA
jgi:hypothetical protein